MEGGKPLKRFEGGRVGRKSYRKTSRLYSYLPHPLNPPLHDMDIYSYHEGEEFLKEGR